MMSAPMSLSSRNYHPIDPQRLFELLLLGIYISSTTIFASRLTSVLIGGSTSILLLTQISIILFYCLKAFVRGNFLILLAALLVPAYFMVQHFAFTQYSGSEANFAAALVFSTMPAFIVFSESDVPVRRQIDILALVSGIYCLIYVLGYSFLSSALAQSGGLLADDGVRGARLFLAATWAAFAVYYGVTYPTNIYLRMVLIIFGLVAIYLSGSRVFQGFFFLALLAAIWPRVDAIIRAIVLASLAIVSSALLFGFVSDTWNPFTLFNDASAAYRAMEYARVKQAIAQFWLFGVGMPDSAENLSFFLKQTRAQIIHASDLGVFGVILSTGIIGFVLFLYAAYFVCVQIRDRSFSYANARAVQLTCVLMVGVGVISPMLLFEPSSLFACMLLAMAIRRARSRSYKKFYTQATTR